MTKWFSLNCLLISVIAQIILWQILQPHNQLNNTSTLYNGSQKINDTNMISFSRLNVFKHNFPPFLISYPASGNTFTRHLLEFISLYHSITFDSISSGNSTIIIKVHSVGWENEHLQNIIDMQFDFGTYRSNRWKYFKKIWEKYNGPTSAIFLLRDIFKTCWSFFQWQYADKYDEEIANKYDEEGQAVRKHTSSFIMTKNQFRNDLLRKWRTFSLHCSNEWLNTFNWINKFKKNNQSILVIEFDQLISKNKYERQSQMIKILQFLFNKNYLQIHQDIMMMGMEQIMGNASTLQNFSKLFYRVKNRENRIDMMYAYSILSDAHICKMLKNGRKQSLLTINSPRKINC